MTIPIEKLKAMAAAVADNGSRRGTMILPLGTLRALQRERGGKDVVPMFDGEPDGTLVIIKDSEARLFEEADEI